MVLIASFSTPPRVELYGSFENFGMNLLLLMALLKFGLSFDFCGFVALPRGARWFTL
jgi:hypothetical protein